MPVHGGSFPTTRWSLVLSARVSGARSQQALESLCRIYWPAIYTYARYRGYSAEDAEDLTQGFFVNVLEKHYIQQADRERGKFRIFLLTSFKHYLANEWDRAQTLKRGGGQTHISLDFDTAEQRLKIEPATATTPETLFEKQWAQTLLKHVLDKLRSEMAAAGNAQRFETLKGFLIESGDSYRDLAAELETTESTVKVAVHRMRRRFARLLREHVEDTVEKPEDVNDEIRFLIGVLSS